MLCDEAAGSSSSVSSPIPKSSSRESQASLRTGFPLDEWCNGRSWVPLSSSSSSSSKTSSARGRYKRAICYERTSGYSVLMAIKSSYLSSGAVVLL